MFSCNYQSWKLWRFYIVPFLTGESEVDLAALWVDFFAGFGGFCYFFGCIYFLPWLDKTNDDTDVAANWFMLGGLSYTISGGAMLYRYFFESPKRFPVENPNAEEEFSRMVQLEMSPVYPQRDSHQSNERKSYNGRLSSRDEEKKDTFVI